MTITDVNDNQPSFKNKPLVIDLPENSKSGTVLGTVQAEDADEITTFIYRFEEQDKEDGFRVDIYKRDGTKTSDYVKNVKDLPVEISRRSGVVKLRNGL